MNPEISILLSVKNEFEQIKKSIDSVLSQSFENFEFLIINDGSSDKTQEILSSYKDKRIKLFKNEKNIGLTKSLNLLLEEAKGNLIARIDADDYFLPNKLEVQLKFLNENQDIGLCVSCCKVIDYMGNDFYSICPDFNRKSLKWNLIFRNNIRHSTAVWRSGLKMKYDENFLHAQDYELWCRMTRIGIEIGVVSEETTKAMNRERSITNKFSTSQETYACCVTKKQLEFFLEKKISLKEAENIRLICAQKCNFQFEKFNKITNNDLKKSINLYMELANKFYKKEKINEFDLIGQINGDLSILLSGSMKIPVLIEIFKWFKNKEKNEFVRLVEENFIKIKEQENWSKNIKFI